MANRAERQARALAKKIEIKRLVFDILEDTIAQDRSWREAILEADCALVDLCRRYPQEAALIRRAGREVAALIEKGIEEVLKKKGGSK